MAKKRLLVIEDDARIAELICRAAQEADFESEIATGDEAALSCRNSPDVIMLDLVMPGKDGFEIIHYLSRHYTNIPLLIVSGHDTYREMAEKLGSALGLNVVGQVAKPFRIAALREKLQLIALSLDGQQNLPLGRPLGETA